MTEKKSEENGGTLPFFYLKIYKLCWGFKLSEIKKGLPSPANPCHIWRARRDYFKTYCENLVQEIGGQIEAILAA
jgi:hypothetical protein